MKPYQIALFVLLTLGLSGCAIINRYDISSKYKDAVGRQYRTRFDCNLWKMFEYQYEFVPYRLEPAETDIPSAGKKIVFVPEGSVFTVVSAKRSYVGGDWDYIIAEITIPGNGEKYTFEYMLGFSSFKPADLERPFEPTEKQPNKTSEPTAMTRPPSATIPAPLAHR